MEEIKQYKRVLTIAGSDSGGGAGIQADIKTIAAHGCYASSAITAITVQNTMGVRSVMGVPADIVAAQVDAVLSDIGTDAVKIGMLYSAEIVRSVADVLKKHNVGNIVLDTVLVSTSGKRLLSEEGIEAMKECLFPIATVVTPNLPECTVLLESQITSEEEMRGAAEKLSKRYGTSFLIKGGHLPQEEMADLLYDWKCQRHETFVSNRIATRNSHGTGCTLSSAIAANLAMGKTLVTAVKEAKDYLTQAMLSGSTFEVGQGKGPLNHLFTLVK